MKFECEVWPEELAKSLIRAAWQSEELTGEMVSALYWLRTAAENPLNQTYFRTFYRVLEALAKSMPEDTEYATGEANTLAKLVRSCGKDRLLHLVEADKAGRLAVIPSVRKNDMGWDLLNWDPLHGYTTTLYQSDEEAAEALREVVEEE